MDPRREAEDRPGETDPRTGSGDSRTGTLKKDRRSLVEIGTAAPPSRPDQGAFRAPAHSGAGKGAGEAGRARLRVATTFAGTLPQDSNHCMNRSQGPEPFGKAPDGALLRSIPFQARRCQAVADVGVIDRSLTGNPARRKTARSCRATGLSRVAGPVSGWWVPLTWARFEPVFPTGNLLRPPIWPHLRGVLPADALT